MTASIPPIRLLGEGPLARAIVEAWARIDGAPALHWRVDPANVGRARWLRRHALQPRIAAGSLVIDATAEARTEATTIDTGGSRVVITRGVGKPKRVPSAEVLAAAPLLSALESGPGLRWVTVDFVDGGRRPVGLGGLGSGLVTADDALTTALERRLPNLAGRLTTARAGSPQLGSSVHISAILDSRGTLDGVRDSLAQLAAATDPSAPFEVAPGVRSDEALGCGRVLIDSDALRGVGPLVHVLAHYEPTHLLAAHVWRRAC